MDIRVIGSNIEIGEALTQYVEENLAKSVKKYFEKAVNAVVHFSKSNQTFKVVITVNEGVKGGINVKSDAEAKIEAFIAAKPVAAAYKDMLLKQIPAIVTKAATFKTPVLVKVEIINKRPMLTVVGAKAVKGIGKFFAGGAGAKGSAGAMGV